MSEYNSKRYAGVTKNGTTKERQQRKTMNEKHFDIFISFKNRDETGAPSQDQAMGFALHEALMAKGIRTFFCNSTLLSLGESTYKKAINEALDSSSVLVVIGTKPEFISSPWVRYEWGSFHDDILSGRKPDASIITYLSDMDASLLPRELRGFESFCSEETPLSEVVGFIENMLHADSSIDASKSMRDRVEQEMSDDQDNSMGGRFLLHQNSDYSPALEGEKERLAVQGQILREKELAVLERAIERIGRDSLTVLDYGGAFGHVARDRFAGNEKISKIISVDICEETIKEASIENAEEKMEFRCIKDGDRPSSELRNMLRSSKTAEANIVFCTMVLQHAKKPALLVRELASVLSPDGFFYARNAEDSTKVCYPDPENVLNQILDKYSRTTGASDRRAGRKLQDYFRHAGLYDIRMIAYCQDTDDFNYAEREELFKSQFSWRLHGCRDEYLADVTNPVKASEYEWMHTALTVFHEMLLDDSFWYSFVDFGCIGWKQEA